MALSGSRLHTLGDLAGLARFYTNAWGIEQPIADETLRTLLTALGLGADTEAVAGSSVAEIDDQRWGRALEPVFVVEHDEPSPGDPVVVAAAAKVSRVDWMVRAENGSEFSGSSVVAEMPVLERRGSRGRAFRHFGVEMGDALQNFAAFEALQDHFRGQGASLAWRDWPTPFRDPGSAVVSAFAQEHAERVEFSVYLQSEADRQLASAALAMLETGMKTGLFRDIVVGVDPDGAEAWSDQSLLSPTPRSAPRRTLVIDETRRAPAAAPQTKPTSIEPKLDRSPDPPEEPAVQGGRALE